MLFEQVWSNSWNPQNLLQFILNPLTDHSDSDQSIFGIVHLEINWNAGEMMNNQK